MRVMLAEDSALFRDGLARLLGDAGVEVLAAVADGTALASALAGETLPDVVIVDIRMPPGFRREGLDAALLIRARYPSVAVLVLSQHVEAHHAVELLAAGTRGVGYLVKDRVADVTELIDALHRLRSGGSVIDADVVSGLVGRQRPGGPLAALSARERDVLAEMAQGRSNRAIAERLHLGSKTVETHIRNVFARLGLAETPDDHRRVLAVLTYLRS